MKILVIWEEIPEHSKVYQLVNLIEEEEQKVFKCQGQFLGQMGCAPEVEWLSNILEGMEPVLTEKDDKPVAMIDFNVIIITGQML